MEWLVNWSVWHWVILGFVLLIAELMIPGVFLLWWGLAALITAGLMTFSSLSLIALTIIYALLALLLSLIWWKYQHSKDLSDQSCSSLNQRDHAMLKARGTVQEIAANGIGRGYFGDTTWRIQGKHLQVGDVIEVEAVAGITLQVRKIKE
ncbi:NfeD family protein [Actinobacillus seminis]|uniref:NfeD family protein n=1 Tax=Actinobacillus seminis TaxID=722 RepID=UPI003B9550D8